MLNFRIIGDNVYDFVCKNNIDQQKLQEVTHLTDSELRKLYSGNLIIDIKLLDSIARIVDSSNSAEIFLSEKPILDSIQIHYMKSTKGVNPTEETISELLDVIDEYVNLSEIKNA